MRSGDMTMPEEHTRIEVDSIADLLLCPDERSRGILEAEGVPRPDRGRGRRHGRRVLHVRADRAANARTCSSGSGFRRGRTSWPRSTATRTSSEPRLGRIVEGLNGLDEPVVFPAHPRTRDVLHRASADHVRVVEPLSYLDFAALASQARVIVTDSGGLQKEAYWYGVPCVTARPSTEWVDTVEQGANILVDDDPERLVAAVAAARPLPADRPALYGDGRAAPKIAEALCTLFAQ